MKNTKTFFKDTLPDFMWEMKKVLTVLFYEVVLALVVMGVCYATNFHISITPVVQTISPIQEVK
jgi:hypothetical protein